MTKRILIVGNSHVAAIKESITQNLITTNVKIDYLAIEGGGLLPNLAIKNTKLHSYNPKVLNVLKSMILYNDGLDLNHYDYVVVYGCQLISRGNGRDWVQKVKEESSIFSGVVRKLSYIDSIRNTSHYEFLSKITSKHLKSKFLSVPSPLPNIEHPGFKNIKSVAPMFFEKFEELVMNEINDLGINFMKLPKTLLSENGYSVSKNFQSTNIEKDVSHLNPQGGAIVMSAVLERIDIS